MNIYFPPAPNFMSHIVPFIDTDNDFTLVGSMSQMGSIPKNVDWNKVIVYNWDHYDFIDMENRPDWVKFHWMCRKAREVWMPTHAHASYYRRDAGIDSYVINLACVIPEEWDIFSNTDGGYALMSSRRDGYKRFDWFVAGCEYAGIPFKTTHPEDTSRPDFIETMKHCRFYVQASLDESLGGLSLMEAVYNRKPVLMSDSILGGREIYGDTIRYFKWDDVDDLAAKLKEMYDKPEPQPGANLRIENYTPMGVAQEINYRLWMLKSALGHRAR